MIQCKSSPTEFIKEAFAPMVAVMHTTGVDEVCKKNNLNFIQIIKPFSKTTLEGLIRDPSSGCSGPVRNLKIAFCDINARPPPPTVARSYFNHSISSNFTDKTTKITIGEEVIDIPVSTPWFEAWRDTFLQVQYPSEHEFTKHFVGCLIVISSLDPSPLEKLEELLETLQGLLTPGPNKLPKWLGPSILTTFLYLHDSSSNDLDVSVFEAMKVTYGINKCFLLSINSQSHGERAPPTTDPWARHVSSFIDYKENGSSTHPEHNQGFETAEEAGERSSPTTPVIIHPLSPISEGNSAPVTEYIISSEQNITPEHGKLISPEDIDRIKQFINDFCIKALIPHFEQLIHQLSDQVSNRKGVSRSLFSATKRWFGSNKPGTPGNHISPTAIAYSSDSHELQLRKLGDLCFMAGQYSLAFGAYHSAKRDFGADGAWLHYAGALEMAALSAFMSNSDTLSRKVVEYAEESILTYQNACRMNQFATRATLLSVECLKARGLFGEAAKQLIRMSGEDSDLRSAVLLEQAAYCFLSNTRPIMHRKYAFHMVLAGHRFSKASHRNHSMRCYKQAFQIYATKSWSIAEDHILYTIGKHASHLKLPLNAFESMSLLVTRPSRQSATQQEMYLKDYLLSIQQLYQKSDDEVILSLPIIDTNLIQVALNMPGQTTVPERIPAGYLKHNHLSSLEALSDQSIWSSLEERIVNTVCWSVATAFMVFKPTVDLLSNWSDNSSSAIGFIGEPIVVCICLRNPLNVVINLKNIVLLWTMNAERLGESEDNSKTITGTSEATVAEIALPPDSARYVTCIIVPENVGNLHITGLSYTLQDTISDIEVSGQQPLVILKKNKVDRRLHISVVGNAPRLEVTFSGLKKELISREILPFNIHLKNIGSIGISKIVFTCSENFRIFVMDYETQFSDQLYIIDFKKPLEFEESLDLTAYLQPISEGTRNLDLLFYYESGLKNFKPSFRLVKFSWPTIAYSNINIKPTSNVCDKMPGIYMTEDEKIARFHIKSKLFDFVKLQNFQIESATILNNNWNIINFYIPNDMQIYKGEDIFVMIKVIPADSNSVTGFTCAQFITHSAYVPDWIDIFVLNASKCKKDNSLQFSFSWSIDMVSMEEGARKSYGQDYVIVPFEDIIQSPISSYEKISASQMVSFPSLKKISESELEEANVTIRVQGYTESCIKLPGFGSYTVPVTVEIVNFLQETIEVSTSFVPLPQISMRELSEDNTSDKFTWLGRIEHSESLVGKGKVILTAAARISGPGAYDVSARVKVEAFDNRNFPVKTDKGDCVIVIN